MITLRPHQVDLLDRTRAALPIHRSVMLYSPPGSGKTVIAAAMAHGASRKRKRVVFGCHRKEILSQTALTFDQFGIQYGYIAAGMPSNPFAPVQIASIDTLRNRFDRWPSDLLVVDEAHLSGAQTWSRIIDHYRSIGAFVIGLSGSPCRLDGKPLRSNFAHMVEGPQNRWLMDHGYLSQYRAFAPARMDTTGLHTRAGDYITAELEERFDRPSIIGDAVSSWRQFANGLRTVVYSFSIEHSKHVVDVFHAAGIAAAHIDGATPKDERKSVIRDFADGKITVLSSVEILTTGFDLSAQVGRDVPIQAVSLLRPTKSLALAIQMMGRGLRPKPQPAIILDHAGILRDHGLPDQHREWSLDGQATNKKPGEAVIPTVTCHECFAVYRPAYACPFCGVIRQVNGREIEIQEGELAELDIERMRAELDQRRQEFEARDKRRQEGMARTVADLAAIAKERNYKPGWIMAKAKAKGIDASWNEIMRAMA